MRPFGRRTRDRRSLRRRFAPSLTSRQSPPAMGAAAELAEALVAG